MKKIARYGLCGMAALMLLAGCTKKPAEAETEGSTEATSEAVTEAPAATESEPTEIPLSEYGTVVLGEYKGLEITGVSAEEIEKRVEEEKVRVLTQYPDYVEVDRPAIEGDTVNIDYVGLLDGEAFQGGTDQGFDLVLGSGQFIPGFEEGLIGYSKGDEVSLNVTFPEVYQSAELAGQAVVFEVTINSVEEKKEAELTDDYIQKISDFTTADEFIAAVKADIEQNAEYEELAMIIQAAIDNAEFTCNPDAIQQNADQYYQSYLQEAARYGVSIEVYASGMYGIDVETLQGHAKTQGEQYVKQQILFRAVAEAEGMVVEDADRELVAANNNASVEELINQFGQERVDDVARSSKAIDFLSENAIIK